MTHLKTKTLIAFAFLFLSTSIPSLMAESAWAGSPSKDQTVQKRGLKNFSSKVRGLLSKLRRPRSSHQTKLPSKIQVPGMPPVQSQPDGLREIKSLEAESYAEVRAAYPARPKNRPIHEGRIGDHPVQFLEYQALGDGDCGFHVLGTSRAEMIARLKHEIDKNNPTIIEHLQLLMVVDDSGSFQGESETFGPDLIKYFLDTVMISKGYHLQGETVGVLAQLLEKSVRIWTPEGGGKLRLTYALESQAAHETVDVLFTPARIHYNLLVAEKNTAGRLDAALREKVWTARFLQDNETDYELARAIQLSLE
ncbi:MAG: hypothetical protein HYX41_06940 [Bdellovibrio sp.]|nr:hypothetical protein [Bdellovibrio sp.]